MQLVVLAVATSFVALGGVASAAPSVDSGTGRYAVRALAPLGGTSAVANSLNDIGWATGSANVAGDGAQHASLWLNDLEFDLGTFGGPNSAVDWPVKNDRGQVVGIAETATPDPLGENFCRYKTGMTCRGFLWQQGVMTKLPTLGGNNGYAAGGNDHGQFVGWAEDATHDSTCIAPQVLQYEAVVYGPSDGAIAALPPFGHDADGAAVAINDAGQAVGISGPCADADGLGARHAVLWENGKVTNLGGFGGTIFNTADAINASGTIAGFATLRGNAFFHGFTWTKQSGISDLGTLAGDRFSEATGINARGQVVGGSCDANFNCRAVIWENGRIIDLNTLVAPLSPLYLTFAGDINDRGEIAGSAYDAATGIASGFRGIQRDGASGAARPSVKRALPAAIRQALRARVLGRFGARLTRPL